MLRWGCPAKVNLCLRVIGRRDDGYHSLQSLVVFAGVSDTLTFAPATTFTFTQNGKTPQGPDNYCTQAAALFSRAIGVEVTGHLHLEKTLPMGAGLGGGTQNGVGTLRLLNKAYDFPLDEPQVMALAAHLGADGTVCAYGRAAWVGGTGERLAAAPPLPEAGLVLVAPLKPLSTKQVFTYSSIPPAVMVTPPQQGWASVAALATWLGEDGGNSLLDNATTIEPTVGLTLRALQHTAGCAYAGMSGSGSSCFGMYENADEAKSAAADITQKHPDWWVRSGRLLVNSYDI